MPIKSGDKATVEYTGSLEDGTIFDSSERQGKPLEVEVGAGQVITGFEQAIIGMKKGEEKEVTLQPDEAYGGHNPQLVKSVPRSQIPRGPEPKVGMLIGIGLKTGQQIPATVTEIFREKITLDLNHPLAGKVLLFRIKVLSIG